MLDVNRQFRVPAIRTELPGPKARRMVERDQRVTSPSYTRVYPLVVARGEGAIIEDLDGNRFLDFNAGIAVCSTGHCHPRVVQAIQRQAANLLHMSGTDFYYPTEVELAEKLTQITPGKFAKRVFFTNSGTESVEAAIKLARYHTRRQNMIAFYGCFHGRTMGAVSLTSSKVTQRRGFGPLLPGVIHVPYADCRGGKHTPGSGTGTIERIEKTLFRKLVAPDEVAAIFVEPIQGEGGYLVPPPEFHRELRALCDRHGILFVADEIQSGMGRTGKMCAIEHWGVEPDIICLAKGIASGMPLGAIVARADLMDCPPGSLPVGRVRETQTQALGNRRRAGQGTDDRLRPGGSRRFARARRGRESRASLFPQRPAPFALRRECDSDLPAARGHSGKLRDGAGHHLRMPGRVGRCPGQP